MLTVFDCITRRRTSVAISRHISRRLSALKMTASRSPRASGPTFHPGAHFAFT
ncbi:unnamed protein product, partial [Nesidiocoris tenuis]